MASKLSFFSSTSHNGPPLEPAYESHYINIFEFEKYNHTVWHDWMHRNWAVSVYASGIYVLLIFLGQFCMRNFKPLGLRGTLLVWNLSLAAFSALGFARMFPELWYEIYHGGGFKRSTCFVDNHVVTTSFWGLSFALSKIVEFGDTFFIVLRKQPLIFLHWYHHVSVCIYCWFAYADYDPSSRWFCTMNYFVHALMYTYYAMKVLKIKIWRPAAMCLTTLQLMQMIVGVVINVYTYSVKIHGGDCNRPYSNIHLAFAMYASYFVLFAKFFHDAYLKNKKQKKQ